MVNPTTEAHVVLDITPRVATITLNSPRTRNALSSEFLAELLTAIQRAGEADSRVIVLAHAPPVFCSGLDLKQVAGGSVDLRGLAEVILALRHVCQPTIAVITGPVRAGGLGIMAACDLVIVAPVVNFAFTEVKLGAVPAAISVPILARVEWSKVVAAFITGEEFDAVRALAIGLVTHVADDPPEMAQGLITSICAAGPEAVATTIKILRQAANDSYEVKLDEMRQLSEQVFESAEAQEGIAAFLEKRPPSWRT
jgi:enoyl-CoA hydratase/carnithine racemase